MMGYLAFNRGFKSGVYSTSSYNNTNTGPLAPVDPEDLNAYTVGLTIALEIVLTGRRMGAAEALRLGLLNQVVPPERVLEAAKDLARSIMRGAPLASEGSKQAADMALQGHTLKQILDAEDGEPKSRVMRSTDMQEGIKAFFEKRAPHWQGR